MNIIIAILTKCLVHQTNQVVRTEATAHAYVTADTKYSVIVHWPKHC